MKFLLIHSTGGSPEETFFPWLKNELADIGFDVFSPKFPTPEGQSLESWMKEFEKLNIAIDENTMLLGRSIGAPFALRLLEKHKAHSAFLVSGFCSKLNLPEFAPLINSFVDNPFNWSSIRKNCKHFFVYNSDDDPYIPLDKAEELSENLKTKLNILHKKGHVWDTEFTCLLNDIKSVL